MSGKDNMKQLKICRFTEPELDVFRRLCNFTPDERKYFELRARDKSNVAISLEMNLSESRIYAIAKEVKRKIIKVL